MPLALFDTIVVCGEGMGSPEPLASTLLDTIGEIAVCGATAGGANLVGSCGAISGGVNMIGSCGAGVGGVFVDTTSLCCCVAVVGGMLVGRGAGTDRLPRCNGLLFGL